MPPLLKIFTIRSSPSQPAKKHRKSLQAVENPGQTTSSNVHIHLVVQAD